MNNQTPDPYFYPNPNKKKIPWLIILAVVLGVVAIAFIVIFFFQKSSFNKEINKNQKEVQELNDEIQRLRDLRSTIKELDEN